MRDLAMPGDNYNRAGKPLVCDKLLHCLVDLRQFFGRHTDFGGSDLRDFCAARDGESRHAENEKYAQQAHHHSRAFHCCSTYLQQADSDQYRTRKAPGQIGELANESAIAQAESKVIDPKSPDVLF